MASSSTSVPRPWEPSLLRSAFLHQHNKQLQAIFAAQRKALELRTAALGNETAASLFAVLHGAGMVSGALGLDFTPLQEQQYSNTPANVLTDPDVRRALELLVFPVDIALEKNAVVAKTLFACDQPARRVGTLSPIARPRDRYFTSGDPTFGGWANGSPLVTPAEGERLLLQRLHADGFVRLSDWTSFGLDLRALTAQVDAAMMASSARHFEYGTSSRAPLPALLPLLNSTKIAHVLRSYLGGPVRYDGHVILKLTKAATVDNYVSSQWHHDRCGRRLKLFIFLHDVDAGARPTLVAARSHNMFYYTHGNPWNLLSRYSEPWVRKQYHVEPMLAPGGGGFIFDTNALHRGEVRGNRTRLAVILEFHAWGKIRGIMKQNNPCPSFKQASRAVRAAQPGWEQGLAGFPLYPSEAPAPKVPKAPKASGSSASGMMKKKSRAEVETATLAITTTEQKHKREAQELRVKEVSLQNELQKLQMELMASSSSGTEKKSHTRVVDATAARPRQNIAS